MPFSYGWMMFLTTSCNKLQYACSLVFIEKYGLSITYNLLLFVQIIVMFLLSIRFRKGCNT